jgi:hypothetical protein
VEIKKEGTHEIKWCRRPSFVYSTVYVQGGTERRGIVVGMYKGVEWGVCCVKGEAECVAPAKKIGELNGKRSVARTW